jgi:hypothetical protein
MMQLVPDLLRDGFGWNHEFNALDNFAYDDKHQLYFRPWSEEYALHTVPPKFPELIPGVRFFDSLKVPFEAIPPVGKQSFDYLRDILAYFKKQHPAERFIVHTGLDEAQCKGRCNSQVKQPDGRSVIVGATVFTENVREFCKSNHLECLHPHVADESAPSSDFLIFESDGHYNVRGHQWLAAELTKGVAPLLGNSPGQRPMLASPAVGAW